MSSSKVTCGADSGLFEPSLGEWTCTPPCPIPAYDTDLIQDNWTQPFRPPQYQVFIAI